MPVNSHIQIPNAVLRNFRNPFTGKVFHLDLTLQRIRSCSSDILGTEYGYFSDEMEQYLSKKIEKPFSELVSSVRAFLNSDCPLLEMPIAFEDTCKRYISSAMYRSGLALKMLIQGSVTAPFVSAQENHDDLVRVGLQHNNGIFPQLADYEMIVLVNRTQVQFVVPRNCFFEVSSHSVKCLIAPISPDCALCLAPKEFRREIIEDAESRMGFLDNAEDVWVSNNHALQFEYVFNHGFVAAANKTELQNLLKYLNSQKSELEKIRTEVMR